MGLRRILNCLFPATCQCEVGTAIGSSFPTWMLLALSTYGRVCQLFEQSALWGSGVHACKSSCPHACFDSATVSSDELVSCLHRGEGLWGGGRGRRGSCCNSFDNNFCDETRAIMFYVSACTLSTCIARSGCHAASEMQSLVTGMSACTFICRRCEKLEIQNRPKEAKAPIQSTDAGKQAPQRSHRICRCEM